jgi:peptidoglycan hydrolase CwlO-like protein
MSEVMLMSMGNKTRDIRTDLEWKRSYLSELEKKRKRQQAAVADTDVEVTTVQKEIAKLEKQLERSQKTTD